MQLWHAPSGPQLYVDAEDTAYNNQTAYTNHQCDPNCESEHHNLDGRPVLKLVATRDILSGDKLTFNYCYQVDEEGGGFLCTCNRPTCLRWVGHRADQNENSSRKRTIEVVDS